MSYVGAPKKCGKQETIRFVHESISREAFGNGVIFAAKNLLTKPKGYYKYEDLLQEYFVQK